MNHKVINQTVEDAEPEGMFHAMLCDPPYELGFMGKDWDASGVAFHPETWAKLAEHLYPGAFGMAFASSRGWHRLAVAIEDAGLIIHPSIFGWSFGSGFPKATRIDTQVDAAAGVDVQRGTAHPAFAPRGVGYRSGEFTSNGHIEGRQHKPATDLAKSWEGHRYGRQSLKPALEPIIVFQKPYKGKPIDCITETGAGALNIDGGRIGNDTITAHGGGVNHNRVYGNGKGMPALEKGVNEHNGRWPSNLVLHHTPECNGNCIPECPVARMDEQSGDRPSNGRVGESGNGHKTGLFGNGSIRGETYWDTGGASRFFYQVQTQINESDPVRYCAKASRDERDSGLEGMALQVKRTRNSYGDQSDYDCPDGANRVGDKGSSLARNNHPTIKPIDLTKYLATLLLPPDDYAPRRILIPFSGAGSEMIGACLADWEEVVGIEMDSEYCEIAEKRLKFWNRQPKLF